MERNGLKESEKAKVKIFLEISLVNSEGVE